MRHFHLRQSLFINETAFLILTNLLHIYHDSATSKTAYQYVDDYDGVTNTKRDCFLPQKIEVCFWHLSNAKLKVLKL